MNALIIGSTFYLNEMKDFFQVNDLTTYFAENTLAAIDVLNHHEIDFAFINIHSISEVILLKYINQNHQKVKVILLTNPKNKEVISILKEGFYHTLEDPFRFQEIQTFINEKKKKEEK
jgi:DNA-binding NtrC family response regulator